MTIVNKEWETEPNEENFIYKNYNCKIWRNPDLKSLAGYVRIEKEISKTRANNLRVHWGITFNGSFKDSLLKNDTGHWIGFDCGHGGDLTPYFLEVFPALEQGIGDITYKNFAFVKEELKQLVDQLIKKKIKNAD